MARSVYPGRGILRASPVRLALALLAAAALMLAPLAHADRIVLLVDNSGSMRGNDAERLVPEAVLAFVAGLAPETDVALVAFDSSARLLSPLGPPGRLRAAVLDQLDYRGQLTDPASAVERALYELREANPRIPGRDAIVLLTDGVIDLGNAGASLRAEDWLLGDLRADLVARDISVWAIALTDAADFRLLSQLTDATGGRYYRALAAADVDDAIGRIGAGIAAMHAAAAPATPEPVAPVVAAPRTTTTPARAPAQAPVATPRVEVETPPIATRRETPARPSAAAPARTESAPAETRAPAASPSRVTEAPASPSKGANLRWWLAFAFLAIGVALLGWVSVSTWRDRRGQDTAEEPALEYFPDCYLVDLHGVTDRPTHRMSGKYNMITRLQNPPDDGINYIQVFRRQIGRRHALIEYRDFSFWVIDQNSLNGTFLNGERLTSETRLKHGDRLRFHIFEFEFCVSDLALSNETLIEQERAVSR